MVQVATPSQIYEAPNSIYTADFIGDVNIISGTAKPESRQISIVWDAEHAPIIAPSDASFGTDDTIHFAIRPEKVGISAEKPAASENSYQGKILDIAYLGNISTYHVELPQAILSRPKPRIPSACLSAGSPGKIRSGFTFKAALACC